MRFVFSVLWLLLAISAYQHHHVSPTKWVLNVARPKSCRLQLGAPKCNVVWAKHGFQKGEQLVQAFILTARHGSSFQTSYKTWAIVGCRPSFKTQYLFSSFGRSSFSWKGTGHDFKQDSWVILAPETVGCSWGKNKSKVFSGTKYYNMKTPRASVRDDSLQNEMFFLQQGQHNDSKEMMPLKSEPSGVAKYNYLFLAVNKEPPFCR